MVFQKHCPNCVVITDCFEIFTDRQTNLFAYSQYNICTAIGKIPNWNTTKYSNGWGGWTRDKYITENSSFPTNLNGTQPIDFLSQEGSYPLLDKAVYVCCALNM